MPCLKLHAQVDFDLAFVGEGLLLQYYDQEHNPHKVIHWDKLDKELIDMAMDNGVHQDGWNEEMRIAMQLIALGTTMKNKLMEIKDDVRESTVPPIKWRDDEADDDDDDDDDAGEEWKQG